MTLIPDLLTAHPNGAPRVLTPHHALYSPPAILTTGEHTQAERGSGNGGTLGPRWETTGAQDPSMSRICPYTHTSEWPSTMTLGLAR